MKVLFLYYWKTAPSLSVTSQMDVVSASSNFLHQAAGEQLMAFIYTTFLVRVQTQAALTCVLGLLL